MTEMSPGVKGLIEWTRKASERLDRIENICENCAVMNDPIPFGQGSNDWSTNRKVDELDSLALVVRLNEIDQRIDCIDQRVDALDKLVRRLLQRLEKNPLDRVIAIDFLNRER